ncbi:hypothetical protein DPMN_177405 [Dreissena polymorpha]|uniref:Uncharacterized protein n=1 Tax=Dreissena polymorpha TaxID=45954 RepID=A0A9D4EBM5_DREPO|nr:hypothetical protein DPMN_177405 [Dreissena polymorpha]
MLVKSYLFAKETTNCTGWSEATCSPKRPRITQASQKLSVRQRDHELHRLVEATCSPKRPRIVQTSLELHVRQRDHELHRLVRSYLSAKETTNCTG